MYQINVDTQFECSVSEHDYRKLTDASPDATLFNDWPWLSTAVKHCEAEKVFYLSCRAEGELVGFLPLQVSSERLHGIPAKVGRFLQYPWGDRIAIVLHQDHVAAWPALLEALQTLAKDQWDCLIWNEWFDQQGLRELAMRFALSNKFSYHQRLTSVCPIYYLDGKTEQQIVDSYSSKLRSDLKRRKKKLHKLDSQIEHVRPTTDRVEDLVAKMKYTEAQSWKGDEGVGIFNDPEGKDFFADVSKALAKAGQLDLSLIWIDDQLASYKYGFYFRETFLDYSIGYLPQYGKIGLGRVLLDELVLAAAREGYHAVDASRVGAVSKHLLFERTDKTVEHYRAYWFSPGLKGMILNALVVKLKPFMKQLREQLREKYNAYQESKGERRKKAER